MRTPEAIFEEVLDAWDDRERQHILNTPYPGDRGGEAMDRHTERVRYLRQEFRAATQKGVEATAKEGVEAGVRIGKAAGPPYFYAEAVPLPEPAAEGAAVVSYRPTPAEIAALPMLDDAMISEPDPEKVGTLAAQIEALQAKLAAIDEVAAKGDQARAEKVVDDYLRGKYERPDERAERLASRYTRDDGSSR